MSASPTAPLSRRPVLRAAAIAIGCSALLATPAAAEDGIPGGAAMVSKDSGVAGLPFPARLVSASQDGRFVVMALGNAGSRPGDAPGPEATITSPSGLVVRDRKNLTTLPLVAPAASSLQVRSAGLITDDGTRVLVGLAASAGAPDDAPQTYAVLDRSGALLPLPTPTGLPSTTTITGAFLSTDGASAVISTASATGEPTGIFRGPVGGAGTLVVDLPGATATGASSDLTTIAYRRALKPVPSVLAAGGTFTAIAYGVKQGQGEPHIVVEDTQDIQAVQTQDACIDNPKDWTYSQPKLSGDGGRLSFRYFRHEYYASLPGGFAGGYLVRGTTGPLDRHEDFGPYTPQLSALGATHEVSSSYNAYAKGGAIYYNRQFTQGDAELITNETGFGPVGPGRPPSRYVYAQPFALAGLAPASSKLDFLPTEPVDTAGRSSHSIDEGCHPAPVTAPVGTLEQYGQLKLASPLRASGSMGTLKITTAPAGVRPAVYVQVTVKLFGTTIWTRTIGGDRELTLPKPLWLPPETVDVTVGPGGAQDDQDPKVLTKRFTVQALKY